MCAALGDSVAPDCSGWRPAAAWPRCWPGRPRWARWPAAGQRAGAVGDPAGRGYLAGRIPPAARHGAGADRPAAPGHAVRRRRGAGEGGRADTLALAEFADAALLTVEAQRTSRDDAEGAIWRLRQMRTQLLGVAVLPPVRDESPSARHSRPSRDRSPWQGDRDEAGGRNAGLGVKGAPRDHLVAADAPARQRQDVAVAAGTGANGHRGSGGRAGWFALHPEWSIVVLLAGWPVWWFLGIEVFAIPLLATPMVWRLYRWRATGTRVIRTPPGF